MENIYLRSGRNVYDIRANKTDTAGTKYNRYLNSRPVRKLIGAKTPFHRCPPEIVSIMHDNAHCVQLTDIGLWLAPHFLPEWRLVSDIHKFAMKMIVNSFKWSPTNYAPAVANLLNNGIRVLLYAGDADFRANWVSSERKRGGSNHSPLFFSLSLSLPVRRSWVGPNIRFQW